MRRILTLCCLLAANLAPAAEPTPADYRALNLDLVDNHVVPRYTVLARAGAALEAATGAYCNAPDAARAEAVRAAWHASVDAWQGVQHLRFGPIELFMRGMRMQFWPDPRNNVGRQVEELLAAGDAAAFAPAAFPRQTIAVQGLPAFERLLPTTDGAADGWRCEAMRAIAANVSTMAADTLDGWVGSEGGYRAVVAAAQDGKGHYHDDREAAQDFFKSLHGVLELVAEHKLARPMGDSSANAKPQLAESWPSGRSLDNVRINLAAAEAMYLGERGGGGFSRFVREVAGDVALDDLLRRAFAQTRMTAASIGLPLGEAVVDAGERKKLAKLVREASALKALLAQRLTLALGIPLGFNSMDGD